MKARDVLLAEEGPREKITRNGIDSLSDPELIALILSTGHGEANAISIARAMYVEYEGDLHQLARATVDELMSIRGVGRAKASRVAAVFELSRRRERAQLGKKVRISGSSDVYRLMEAVLKDKSYEEFWMLVLNRSNCVVRQIRISEGSIHGTVADPKKIFKLALQHKASALIFLHNHPSGQIEPSQADRSLTEKLKAAGGILDIAFLDHVIITQGGYYSFADEGDM